MLGNKELAQKIDKIRGGNDNIFLIENNKLNYFKNEKIVFSSDPLSSLNRSLKQNYIELKIELNKSVKNSNFRLINEKIYKNIYGAIKKEICHKIDNICDKHKNELRQSILGVNIESLSSLELELRKKLKEEFAKTYSDIKKKVDFYKIFPQTQIFESYLDKYIEQNK